MECIVYLYRRKQGVTAQQSRKWTLEVDIPITSSQPGIQKFKVSEISSSGEGPLESAASRSGGNRSGQLRGLDAGGRAAGHEEGRRRVALLLRRDLDPGNKVDEDRVAEEFPRVLDSTPIPDEVGPTPRQTLFPAGRRVKRSCHLNSLVRYSAVRPLSRQPRRKHRV